MRKSLIKSLLVLVSLSVAPAIWAIGSGQESSSFKWPEAPGPEITGKIVDFATVQCLDFVYSGQEWEEAKAGETTELELKVKKYEKAVELVMMARFADRSVGIDVGWFINPQVIVKDQFAKVTGQDKVRDKQGNWIHITRELIINEKTNMVYVNVYLPDGDKGTILECMAY